MKTVLVAGDNCILRNMVKNIFAELKILCQFLIAEDGAKDFQSLENNQEICLSVAVDPTK